MSRLLDGLGIAGVILAAALGLAALIYVARGDAPKIDGRAVILYVENGQPVAKWATEGGSK